MNMNLCLRLIFISLLAITLGACQSATYREYFGWFSKDDRYLKAETMDELVIPNGLSKEKMNDTYTIPHVAQPFDGKTPSLFPPFLDVNPAPIKKSPQTKSKRSWKFWQKTKLASGQVSTAPM